MTHPLFPTDDQPTTSPADADARSDPELVTFEDADAIFEALASDTARDIVATLVDEPTTPAALADSVDTSVQNAIYHLDRLADAGLVETAGTRYSERGVEMDVYALAAAPLLVCIGDDDHDRAVASLVTDDSVAAGPVSSD